MQSHAQVTQKKGLPHVVSEGFTIETPENGEVQVVQVVKYGPKNPSGDAFQVAHYPWCSRFSQVVTLW